MCSVEIRKKIRDECQIPLKHHLWSYWWTCICQKWPSPASHQSTGHLVVFMNWNRGEMTCNDYLGSTTDHYNTVEFKSICQSCSVKMKIRVLVWNLEFSQIVDFLLTFIQHSIDHLLTVPSCSRHFKKSKEAYLMWEICAYWLLKCWLNTKIPTSTWLRPTITWIFIFTESRVTEGTWRAEIWLLSRVTKGYWRNVWSVTMAKYGNSGRKLGCQPVNFCSSGVPLLWIWHHEPPKMSGSTAIHNEILAMSRVSIWFEFYSTLSRRPWISTSHGNYVGHVSVQRLRLHFWTIACYWYALARANDRYRKTLTAWSCCRAGELRVGWCWNLLQPSSSKLQLPAYNFWDAP
jgi:hypothetical protein